MSQEELIQKAVLWVEEHTEEMYSLKLGQGPKPPVEAMFKAAAMAEIARRVRARAVKIEEDWLHFTRS